MTLPGSGRMFDCKLGRRKWAVKNPPSTTRALQACHRGDVRVRGERRVYVEETNSDRCRETPRQGTGDNAAELKPRFDGNQVRGLRFMLSIKGT